MKMRRGVFPLNFKKKGGGGRNITLNPTSGVASIFCDENRPHHHIPLGFACHPSLFARIFISSPPPHAKFFSMLFPFAGRRLMDVLSHLSHIGSFAVLIADATRNGRVWFDVGGIPAVTYNLAREDTQRMHRGLTYAADICRAAGAKRIYPAALGA